MIRYTFLFVLSISYVQQEGIASAPASGSLARYLPRSFKAKRVLALIKESELANDRYYLNFVALADSSLPIARVFSREGLTHKKLAKHVMEASHAELNRITALLNVDTKKVIPQISHLSSEEFKNILSELGDMVHDSDIEGAIENSNTTPIAEEMNKLLEGYKVSDPYINSSISETIHDAISMVVDGHEYVITGLHKFNAADELEKLRNIILEAWKVHYLNLDKKTIIDKIRTISEESNISLLKRIMEDGHSLIVEEGKRIVAKLSSHENSNRKEAVEFLIAEKNKSLEQDAPIIFTDTYKKDIYAEIKKEGGLSAKYPSEFYELYLVEEILTATYGLGKQGMQHLERMLKRPLVVK